MIKVGRLQVYISTREIKSEGRSVRVGSRAFEILEALLHSNGALVTKDDLIKKVWPETVVEENNLQVHISSLRKLLGDDRDLIKTVPGRGYRFVRPDTLLASESVPYKDCVDSSYSEMPNPMRLDMPGIVSDNIACDLQEAAGKNEMPRVASHNLPAWTAHLVGRRNACRHIANQLESTRHLSIIGAGGIGKTRVAIEVARSLLSRFAEKVYFVSFAAVNNGDAVFDAFCKATGTQRHYGVDAVQRLMLPFVKKKVLFVLDNCEHVIVEATALADAVLHYCGDARILTTSRESLRTAAETLYNLPPLKTPGSEDTEARILQCSAVTLFLRRARAIDPTFGQARSSATLIGAICRRLDGMPLAIELAAARAVVLGLHEVLCNLGDRFSILTGGHRAALPRHQTLKATFDWSHDLLNADERRVLRRLGVFEESFTLASAKEVVCDSQLFEDAIVPAMIGLAAKSLLVTMESDGVFRYRMLESTRAYALQKLDDNGERCVVEARHDSLGQRREKKYDKVRKFKQLGDTSKIGSYNV